MRRAVILGVMALAASAALAGETYLGSIEALPPAGGTNFYPDGGGFAVPRNQKLSLWCTTDAFVLTDGRGGRDVAVLNDGGVGDAGPGLPVTALRLFPTSTGVATYRIGLDGGLGSPANGGGLVRASGTASTVCHVFQRLGTE